MQKGDDYGNLGDVETPYDRRSYLFLFDEATKQGRAGGLVAVLAQAGEDDRNGEGIQLDGRIRWTCERLEVIVQLKDTDAEVSVIRMIRFT